jgi:hypothetical protein
VVPQRGSLAQLRSCRKGGWSGDGLRTRYLNRGKVAHALSGPPRGFFTDWERFPAKACCCGPHPAALSSFASSPDPSTHQLGRRDVTKAPAVHRVGSRVARVPTTRLRQRDPTATMSAVAETGAGTWLMMLRDVSHAIRVAGQRRVMAALALDAETGLAHGYSVAATGQEALAEAFRVGTTRPPVPLLPGRPERILCSATIGGEVRRMLTDLFDHGGAPPVEEIVDALEAEDIFDSFLGHMAGRGQPTELATPEDWAMFFEVSRRYTEAEPWTRWSDINHLHLDLRLRSQETRYLALVLGNEGIQRGLVLYPGEILPAGLSEPVPPSQVNLPLGTLNFYLDPTRKAPPEYVGKALRYGWPGESKLVPLYMAIGEGGAPFDIGLADVQRITLALTAVLEHDARVMVVEGESATSSGQVTLSDGGTATFAIRQAPAEQSLDEGVRF